MTCDPTFAASESVEGSTQWRPYPVVNALNKEALDFFVFLGDTIYETTNAQGSEVVEDLAGYRPGWVEPLTGQIGELLHVLRAVTVCMLLVPSTLLLAGCNGEAGGGDSAGDGDIESESGARRDLVGVDSHSRRCCCRSSPASTILAK